MTQQEFWNSKFSKEGFLYGEKPNSFIASKINLLKPYSKVLCLGEGEGRNAVFLAKKGFDTKAIDASDIGLSKLHKRCEEESVFIETICMDLNDWETNEKFEAVVASYLHLYEKDREKLFKNIENSLVKDGYFIAEFFSKKQINFNSGGPKDLELLYSIEDFENSFNGCKKDIKEEIIVLDEGKGHQGQACVIRVVIQKK